MWIFFPDWTGEGVEPALEQLLRSHGIQSCTNVSIILNIEDLDESQRLCMTGFAFKENIYRAEYISNQKIASLLERSTKEIAILKSRERAWKSKVDKLISLVTQLQDKNDVLQSILTQNDCQDNQTPHILQSQTPHAHSNSIYTTYDIFSQFRHTANTGNTGIL